jgi:hypothetical protein
MFEWAYGAIGFSHISHLTVNRTRYLYQVRREVDLLRKNLVVQTGRSLLLASLCHLDMWPQQHQIQRNQPPAAALNPAHEVSGHSLKFDEDICLTVPDFRDSEGSLLSPMHNNRTRRRSVKDFVEKVGSLPPAPFSVDTAVEEGLSLSIVGGDKSLFSIFQDSVSKLPKPSCSKNSSSNLGHTSFRGVADEMFALQYKVQSLQVGSLSSSLHGSTTSLQLDDIDAKRSSA